MYSILQPPPFPSALACRSLLLASSVSSRSKHLATITLALSICT
jgi:hypothetical protein